MNRRICELAAFEQPTKFELVMGPEMLSRRADRYPRFGRTVREKSSSAAMSS